MTRILFIDDDVFTLQLMSKVSSLLGYQAILSTSAQSALKIAVNERPSLIVVDMQMDEMYGHEFVRRLRELPEAADLPVVILSAGIGFWEEDQARKAGANAFLQKPIGVNELSLAIQSFAAAV